MDVRWHGEWQVQEAKQRISELLRRAKTEGPQYITKHGQQVAVVLDIDEYHRLTAPPMDFKEFLLSIPKGDDDIFDTPRTRSLHRDIDFSDL